MLKNIFNKQNPRVYLGVLAVVPQTGIKKSFDSWDFTGYVEPDEELKKNLTEIFCLPPSNSISEPLYSDLIIDVVISKFQLGGALNSEIPIFWRPKITLVSRLYHMQSGKTKNTISITEKMPWRQYFSRLLTWQGVFQFGPLFNNNDLEKLLYIASEKVMNKLNRSM